MLSTQFGGIADEIGPAWHEWLVSRNEFEPLIADVAAMMTSQDALQLLRFRIQEKFVRFDMACRRIHRLAAMASWSSPTTDEERALRALTRMLEAQMRETAAFKTMSALSRHIQKLDTSIARTPEARRLRMRQQARQSDLSEEFFNQFTPADRVTHARRRSESSEAF